MRKALAVSLLVVASLVLGTLVTGGGHVADDTRAVATMGLRVSTAPPSAPTLAGRLAPRAPRLVLLRPLALLVQLLLAAAAFVVAVDRPPDERQSLRRAHAGRRRGPPTLLPSRA